MVIFLQSLGTSDTSPGGERCGLLLACRTVFFSRKTCLATLRPARSTARSMTAYNSAPISSIDACGARFRWICIRREFVLATARAVAIAHQYRHLYDSVAPSGKGEAQPPLGLIQKRCGERNTGTLDVGAHDRSPACSLHNDATIETSHCHVKSSYMCKTVA